MSLSAQVNKDNVNMLKVSSLYSGLFNVQGFNCRPDPQWMISSLHCTHHMLETVIQCLHVRYHHTDESATLALSLLHWEHAPEIGFLFWLQVINTDRYQLA